MDQLVAYLYENVAFLRETINTRLPQLQLIEPEGTYLPWVNFAKLNLNSFELDRFIIDRAKLWLDSGPIFGAGGAGFQRFNIAVPRATLQQALAQLESALK